jgi:hypothetical protein
VQLKQLIGRQNQTIITKNKSKNKMETLRDENEVLTKDSSNKRVLTGMFRDRESTENAYNSLHERGYSKDDINLVMSNETRETHYKDDVAEGTEIGTKAAEHAGKGSAIGGTIGAIAGVIAAIGTSVVIPGLGILIAGPIAAGLAGAGAGSLAGGVIGALVGSGIPEARAKLYESGIKEGNVVISVTPKSPEDAEYLEKNWKSNRGEEIHW